MRSPARRRLVLGTAAALAAQPLSLLAQGLSARPVRVLLALTPGTIPDLIARTLAPRLSARWNQPFVVENRAGASGMIGMEALAKSPPDGHTLCINTSSTLTLPLFFKPPFDVLTSFIPVTLIGSNSYILTVHHSVPATDAREFIAWARSQGGKINYGSPGNGTHHHLYMEALKLQTGLSMTHIPYKGFAGAAADLMGGQISAMIFPTGAALAMSRDGKLRLLAGSTLERSALTPHIPTLHEQGVTGYDMTGLFTAIVPAGTPPEIVAKYNALFHAVLAEPETRDSLMKNGVEVKVSTPEEAERLTRLEFDKMAKLVKAANIKGD